MAEYEEDDLNIGNLGELKLSSWCTEARLKSNRSLEEDSTGWDHLIRFPYEKTSLPKDLQPKPLECKVQVKTTFCNDKKGVSIKLSALKHLVDDTSPAFILFFEFSNKQEPELENAYVVHIGEELIEKILKRIREVHLADKSKKLHKVTLWVSYDDSHKLERNSGFALRDRIDSYVPDGIVEYQKKKDEITKTVGYGDKGFIFQFEAQKDDMEKHFLDAAIGRVSKVEIKNSIVRDNRFDLPNGAIELKDSDVATIAISPNVIDKCQLRFKTREYSPVIVFDGEFIKLPDPLSLKNNLFFRTKLFTIQLFDLSIKKDSKIHFALNQQVELDEIVRLFKLFSPRNADKDLTLEVALKENNRTLNFTFILEHYFEDTTSVVDSISILKNSYEIDGKTLTTVDELLKERIALSAVAAIIKNDVKSIRFSHRKTPDSDEFVTEPELTIPYAMAAQIGTYHIGFVALIEGKRVTDIEYQAKHVEILEPLTFYGDVPTGEQLEEIMNKALQQKNQKDEDK